MRKELRGEYKCYSMKLSIYENELASLKVIVIIGDNIYEAQKRY